MVNNADFLKLGAEDIARMPEADFKELVRREAFLDMRRLSRISQIMDGEDLRTMLLGYASFVAAWGEADSSPVARATVSAILRKTADMLDACRSRGDASQN